MLSSPILHQGIDSLLFTMPFVADGALLLAAVAAVASSFVVDHYDLGVSGSKTRLALNFLPSVL